MDCLFEQNVSQNTALSMELLHVTIIEYYKESKGVTGLKFPLAFLVLPMVLQRRTTDAIYNKQKPGSLYKALTENREVSIGLQHRMEVFYEKTMQAISLGISTELFALDYQVGELFPKRKSALNNARNDDIKRMFSAAKRLGQTFHELTIEEISQTLNIISKTVNNWSTERHISRNFSKI